MFRRLGIFMITAFVSSAALWLWSTLQPRSSEKRFTTLQIMFDYQISFSSGASYVSEDSGTTWSFSKGKGMYQSHTCVLANQILHSGHSGNSFVREALPARYLPPSIGNFFPTYLPFLQFDIETGIDQFGQYGNFGSARTITGGVCDRNNEGIFIPVSRKIGQTKYTGLLIGYDLSGYYADGKYRSWTLRPIKDQPFIGDIPSSGIPANPTVVQTHLLLLLLFPPFPLLHPLCLFACWQTIVPMGQRRAVFGYVAEMTVYTLLLSILHYIGLYEGNLVPISYAYLVINAVVGALVGYRLAQKQQFSESFRRGLAIISALVASIVPLIMLSGWWSVSLIIGAFYSFVFFRKALTEYSQRQGYTMTDWALGQYLFWRLCAIPLVLIMIAGYFLLYPGLSMRGESILVAFWMGVMLLYTRFFVVHGRFFRKAKKKNDASDLADRRWLVAQWQRWVSTLLIILGIVLGMQFSASQINAQIYKDMITSSQVYPFW